MKTNNKNIGSTAFAITLFVSLACANISSAQSNATGRLINESTSAYVTPDHMMTAGFVIRDSGQGEYWVVIRAIGPSLPIYGGTDPLKAPKLTVHSKDSRGGDVISGVNSGWDAVANPNNVLKAMNACGAFPLAFHSGDAVLLVTLGPGDHTAQVTSNDGSSGNALVEVYEMPVGWKPGS